MENLETILKYWEEDSVIDQTEPGRELLKIPKLHNKYITILAKHDMAVKKANYDYMRMRKIKWEYYTGKMSQDDLAKFNWEPFQFTLKSDINIYLESDNDLIKILEKKVYHEEAVKVTEAILNELKSRTWQLRSFIDHERFISGA
jgi:Recombination, repair and ssDNA binding protein UvsY